MPALIPTDDPDEESIMHLHIISRADAKRVGLKYYFTGKPCKHGHFSERKTVNGDCYECFASKMSQYRDVIFSAIAGVSVEDFKAKKAEKKLAAVAGLSHPMYVSRADAIARGGTVFFNAIPCKHGHVSNRYVSTGACVECNGIESRIAWRVAYAKNNRESINRNCRRWSSKNKEKINANVRNRRSRVRHNGGWHTADDIAVILHWQKCLCVACGCDISEDYQVDHIIPLALGGSNDPCNLQILCPTCNKRKGAKHPDVWMAELENEKKANRESNS